MTIKAIMVDVDGVLIVHPDACGWSAGLERDLGLPAAMLQAAFFASHWDDVIHGRAPLRKRLGPVLHELAPHVSCDELIDYWFVNDAHLDLALLDELAAYRAGGVEVHLATVQEHERALSLEGARSSQQVRRTALCRRAGLRQACAGFLRGDRGTHRLSPAGAVPHRRQDRERRKRGRERVGGGAVNREGHAAVAFARRLAGSWTRRGEAAPSVVLRTPAGARPVAEIATLLQRLAP